MVLLEKAKSEKYHNGILMETIGISVMVSIGLLLFFFSRETTQHLSAWHANIVIVTVIFLGVTEPLVL